MEFYFLFWAIKANSGCEGKCVCGGCWTFSSICTILPITDEGSTWACKQFSPLCHTWPPLICSYLAITSQEWQQLLLTFMKGSSCLLKMLLSIRPSVHPSVRPTAFHLSALHHQRQPLTLSFLWPKPQTGPSIIQQLWCFFTPAGSESSVWTHRDANVLQLLYGKACSGSKV